MTIPDLVRDYFNREARRFDAIYVSEKPFVQRLVDRLRRVVVERFKLVCRLAPLPGSWTALDVGCGSGRYSTAFARTGATVVVGVDMAESMTKLAAVEAGRSGVSDRCRFVTVPFLDFQSDQRFDVVVAMGYFDYLADPARHLRKMVKLCRGRIFISLPKRWEIRAPVRKLRFVLQNGFVRFYSRRDLHRLISDAGVPADRWSVIDLGRDWVVIFHGAP